jgi:hypothetical protein
VNEPITKNKAYLGDGVYIGLDANGTLWLTTENGIEVTNEICVEREVLDALTVYLDKWGLDS